MTSPLLLTIGMALLAAITLGITEDNIGFKAGAPMPLTDLFENYDQNGVIVYSLNLTESTITGLDQPSKIERDSLTDGVTYSYDLLQLEGQYAQDGVLLVVLPTFGNGAYSVDASDVAITVNVSNPGQDWFFYVNDVNATFQDWLGGGLMTVIGQLFEPSLGDAVVHYFEPQIRDIIESLQKRDLLK